LALGEHLNFNLSYIISAFAVTILVTLYTQAVIKNRYFTITLFGMLLILYSYMYMVLQLEDYALLMGAIGLLAVLAIVMYITRKIDWYNIANEE
jgi:inner membrane protein